MMVNACVTGILPRFRYVLLSDALLESLTPLEVAAVFGHEVGHVAHRHFLYFAFFFIGSLGVLSLLAEILSRSGPLLVQLAWLSPWNPSVLSDVIEGAALLIGLGLYFWAVFGHLSRRFERQADVFGSKVVFLRPCGLPTAHRPGQRPLSGADSRAENPPSARWESGSSLTRWPTSRVTTGWINTADRGGTAASPTESHSSKDSSGIRSGSNAFSGESCGSGSDSASSWRLRCCSRW